MKIFLIIPTLKQGGAERVMSELATQFCELGNNVSLILLSGTKDFYKVDESINIYRLGYINVSKASKFFAEIKLFFSLRNILKKHKPDVVLSFGDKYNVFTILATRFMNLSVFISDRSNPKKIVPYHIELLRKITYKYSTGIIAQTSLAKDILSAKTKHKNIKIIHNPVKEITQYPNISKEKIILNIGRLVPEKGQSYLIEAFVKLNNPEWKLVILGDGPLKEDLENIIQSHGINNSVWLAGVIEDIDVWLAKASIFAFSSISEGFPNALAEAMSSGLPCVSFDCDAGPRDLINNGIDGFLIKERDILGLKEGIERLINDEYLRKEIGVKASLISKKLHLRKVSVEYIDFMTKHL